ncbi:MAG: Tfp pilus assembly protein FimT/FimU [Candidatus Competibacter sp.]|nr:Tfp pilus assembly protein FimT/FimU [Candidatus Competibacter sp.]
MNKETGFTLMELMVTVAVAAILLFVGVPTFQETINNNRLTSNANALVAALNLARSEAIKRNTRVTLCKSADGASCTAGGDYAQGWIVFADPNANGAIDAGEPIIQVGQALSGGLTLTGNGVGGVADSISYVSAGVSQSNGGGPQNGTLTLCKTGYTASSRQLVLTRGGRLRVEKAEPAVGCP